MTNASMQQDPAKALSQFCMWAKSRYELDWTPETLPTTDPREIRTHLVEAARLWDTQKVLDRAERTVAEVGTDPDAIDTWLRETMGAALSDEDRMEIKADAIDGLANRIGRVMRSEVSHLEQWILLQILDGSWKEHLHQMDQLRESIGLRSFSQRDPRIEFKREGSSLFEEMLVAIRDKVTDLVFKARLQAQVRPAQPAPPEQAQAPPESQQPPPAAAPRQPAPPRDENADAVAAAAKAASEGRRPMRRAPQQASRPTQPTAGAAVVGRNEPCPCGSGKKFKKCCGAK
jgi:preprotein translocase subunit SecA